MWKWIPKIIALSVLWGGMGYLVVYVDPASVRDVLVSGLYLPFVGLASLAVWYTTLIVSKSFKVAAGYGVIVVIALVTMILRYMNLMVVISLIGMSVGLGLTLVKRS